MLDTVEGEPRSTCTCNKTHGISLPHFDSLPFKRSRALLMTCSTLSWLAGGVSVALGEGLPDAKCAALVTVALDKLTASVDAYLWLFRQVRCFMA